MRFYAGLDLGQRQDPSALVILEQIEAGDGPRIRKGANGIPFVASRYECGYIQRFQLGLPYPRIVEMVGALLQRNPLAGDCQLVIDHTGVGVAVGNMFAEAGIPYIGVTITGGVGWHKETYAQWHVSKHLLVSTTQKFLSSEAIGISKHLTAATLLRAELQHFRVKVTKAANEIYEAREGQHDDIVLGLSVALFAAEHRRPWVPIGA